MKILNNPAAFAAFVVLATTLGCGGNVSSGMPGNGGGTPPETVNIAGHWASTVSHQDGTLKVGVDLTVDANGVINGLIVQGDSYYVGELVDGNVTNGNIVLKMPGVKTLAGQLVSNKGIVTGTLTNQADKSDKYDINFAVASPYAGLFKGQVSTVPDRNSVATMDTTVDVFGQITGQGTSCTALGMTISGQITQSKTGDQLVVSYGMSNLTGTISLAPPSRGNGVLFASAPVFDQGDTSHPLSFELWASK